MNATCGDHAGVEESELIGLDRVTEGGRNCHVNLERIAELGGWSEYSLPSGLELGSAEEGAVVLGELKAFARTREAEDAHATNRTPAEEGEIDAQIQGAQTFRREKPGDRSCLTFLQVFPVGPGPDRIGAVAVIIITGEWVGRLGD
jgi:hypothetical protein